MPLDLNGLLDMVVRTGLTDAPTADKVRRDVLKNRLDPLRTLTLHARIPSTAVFQALAATRNIEYVSLDQTAVNRDLLERVPTALARRRLILPLRDELKEVLVAVGDPDGLNDIRLRETLQHIFGKPIRLALADPGELNLALDRVLGAHASPAVAVEDAIMLVDELIREAFVRRASDIHLDPEENGFRVRLRVDGDLHVLRTGLPTALALAAISRLKVLAQMDIAESRQPQDGSLAYELQGAEKRRFDIRIATAPTKRGERATLRLLGTDTKELTLTDLGFSERMLELFQELIRRPSGLILLTGPTGSGKTTTLYAALREINRPELNLITVEDPVEYSIPGVAQLEVDDYGKVSFSSALRSLLRHDPDVLMVGEIRDKDTADIALRAATTGHLVFSTLHTVTAVGAVTRLLDLQCEAYMIASTLSAAISQRLVRRLCSACKTPRVPTPEETALLGRDVGQVFQPQGCLRCRKSGYLGRIALCEMFCMDEAAREAVIAGASERIIAQAARRLTTLREDAAQKAAAGLTTVDEVCRALVLEE
jgi:type IV pilus assembly protein PilB